MYIFRSQVQCMFQGLEPTMGSFNLEPNRSSSRDNFVKCFTILILSLYHMFHILKTPMSIYSIFNFNTKMYNHDLITSISTLKYL